VVDLVDFSKYQKISTINPKIINNDKAYDKIQNLHIEGPKLINHSEEKEVLKKPKMDGVWVKVPISCDSPSRLISGVCAVFKIKGYNRLGKEQAFDSMIEYLKTQKEQYLLKRR